jgi:hypothetical protein
VRIEIVEIDHARDVVRVVVANRQGQFTGRRETIGRAPAGRVLAHA